MQLSMLNSILLHINYVLKLLIIIFEYPLNFNEQRLLTEEKKEKVSEQNQNN